MKRRRWVPRGLGVGWCALGLCLASSCYRAEINLAQLMDDPGDSAGSGASGRGGTGGTGAATMGGAGDGGAGGAVECDESPLDALQATCGRLGYPSREACLQMEDNGELSGWLGCYDGACRACTKVLRDYPYYFAWHPCCRANDTCASNPPAQCAASCPAPTEHDKRPRCVD